MEVSFKEWKKRHGLVYDDCYTKSFRKSRHKSPHHETTTNNYMNKSELNCKAPKPISSSKVKEKLQMQNLRKTDKLNKKLALQGWYRITLPHGNKYDKDMLVQIFTEKMRPLSFWPIAWQVKGDIVTFYVDDIEVSEQLKLICNHLKMPDGLRLLIKVNIGSPNIEITDSFKEKLKIAMANRYDATNKSLNLTKFHIEPILQDFFSGLNKQVVLLAVLDIIEENIPELEILNLNFNNISKLKFLKRYISKLSNIKILHLSYNKIERMESIEPLTKLPRLEEIYLEGNPICQEFEEREEYLASEVRDYFKQIKKLDGIELPTAILFDIDLQATLPLSIQTYLSKTDYGHMIGQFLKKYYELYDRERTFLASAYHERALYSYTTSVAYGMKNSNFTHYCASNTRNLLLTKDLRTRWRCLKNNREDIITLLVTLPKSTHDMMGFKVDLTLVTTTMICLTVSGMFREISKGTSSRSFFRTIVIIPSPTGFCICNEEVAITTPTDEQRFDFNKRVPKSPYHDGAITNELELCSNEIYRNTIISILSQRSGMNLQWSRKCLEDTNWKLDKAIDTFNEIHAKGGVPAEAFIR